MENKDVISAVKVMKDFTVSMILKKSAPAIKLHRNVTCKDAENRVLTESDKVICSDLKEDNSGKVSYLQPLKRRRQYNLDKNLVRKSMELETFLNGCNTRHSVDSTGCDFDSSFVSINSDNIKTIMSCIDDELKAKREKEKLEARIYNELRKKSSEEIDYKNGMKENGYSDEGGDVYALEPVFSGYQLVGDSQLLRFAQYILGMPRKVDKDGKGWLGLCVGGQRICDLHKRVLEGFIPIGKKLIILIGTNDILKGTSTLDMCKGLQILLKTLFKVAKKIIVLTLPPIPKLAYLNEHWVKLKKYNDFIFLLKDNFKDKLDVIDVSPLFYQRNLKKCNLGFYELWFEGPVKRPDLIHINEAGFKLIRDLLLKQA